jgi:Fic family protein
MHTLQTTMNVPDKFGELDPLVRCYFCHYQFEAIHPFLDGNGRIGRAVLALMIYTACEHRMPWLYMSAFFERYKSEYIDKLFRVSTNAEWSEWLEFCLHGTVEQADDSISRCEDLQELRRSFKNRVDTDCGPRTHQIIERLFSSPIIAVARWAKVAGIAYQTAKADLQHLERKGILKALPDHTPATYYAPDIYTVAYRDVPSAYGDEEPSSKATSSSASSPPPSQSTSAAPDSTSSPSQPRPSQP